MPSGKTSEPVSLPTFAFGDLSRDEINSVLSQAGVSLLPPKKTPFATGIRKPRVKPIISTALQQQEGINGHAITQQQQQQPSSTASSPALAPSVTPPTPLPTAEGSAASSPVSKAKPVSWAALLRSTSGDTANRPPKAATAAAATSSPLSNTVASATTSMTTTTAVTTIASKVVSTTGPKFVGIADIIQRYEPRFDSPLLEPRGLINNVNTCFMNVILQPLLHCPPFYNLIKTIGQHVVHSFKSKTPLLDSLIEFINEFRPERTAEHKVEPYGEPFVPEYVYDALRGQKRFDSLKGRQEDAEEFLCFLLDGLHEEMVSVLKEKETDGKATTDGQGNGWLEVGPKNKTSNLQTIGYDESPISKIFSGKMRSTLKCPGAKDSVNLEPFQSLPLDIQPDNVRTIEDAIQNITVPEIMHDFISPKNVRVEATKQVYLENLPPVLILHMKRFVFDNVGGVQKLQKPVQYGAQLTIQPEWMTPVMRTSKPTVYRLFGIVYHHGASAGGGHYTCDIRRQNGQWLHINDTNIMPVTEREVLLADQNTRTSESSIHADQTAYILFYMRT